MIEEFVTKTGIHSMVLIRKVSACFNLCDNIKINWVDFVFNLCEKCVII